MIRGEKGRQTIPAIGLGSKPDRRNRFEVKGEEMESYAQTAMNAKKNGHSIRIICRE